MKVHLHSLCLLLWKLCPLMLRDINDDDTVFVSFSPFGFAVMGLFVSSVSLLVDSLLGLEFSL